jgi:maleate cis-trans isomerase
MITPSGVHEINGHEFYLMAPEGVSVAMTSLHSQGWATDSFGRLEDATKEIADRGVNCLVQAGTPHVAFHGWPYHETVVNRIQSVANLPVATDMGSCIDAMQRLQLKRVVMLSPFNDADSEKLASYISHAGIEVAAWDCILNHSVGATGNFMYDMATLPLSTVYRAARDLYRKHRGEVDGIWLTGAAMPTVGAVRSIENDTGVPVVSSMQAMFWAGLRLCGITERINGFGRLLMEH